MRNRSEKMKGLVRCDQWSVFCVTSVVTKNDGIHTERNKVKICQRNIENENILSIQISRREIWTWWLCNWWIGEPRQCDRSAVWCHGTVGPLLLHLVLPLWQSAGVWHARFDSMSCKMNFPSFFWWRGKFFWKLWSNNFSVFGKCEWPDSVALYQSAWRQQWKYCDPVQHSLFGDILQML